MHHPITLKEKITAFLFGIFIGAILMAILLYQIPAVRDRLSWRIDFAMTFLRGVVDPVRPLPTAATGSADVQAGQIDTLPTETATAAPAAEAAAPTAALASPVPTLSPTPTPSPTAIPASVQLAAPAYEKQEINNCGPASIAMHLRYFGWQGDQKTIAVLLKPIPGDRNVNVEELVSYINTQAEGLEAQYRVGGDVEILKKLLAAGFPVTIEEAFPMQESYWLNDDRWAGHYLLLTGYDDNTRMFKAHDSYVGPDIQIAYQELDERWKAFNRVYVVIYPIYQRADIQSILADQWGVNANRQHALEVAQRETELNPADSFAWFNLGTNLVYFEKYSQAAIAYDRARSAGLPQRMLRYQFGPFFAYFHTGRIDDVLELTDYALERTPNSEEAMLWRGWAFYRKGDKQEAIRWFTAALEARPEYSDALYALEFVRSN